ncbi:MAG: GlsB/YeaQ/YmgE family stress response membrane protein [Acidimicrobiia bacterium]
MFGLFVYLLFVGVIAGFLARLLVPGKIQLSFGQTLLVGVIGSYVGGLLGYLIFNEDLDEGALQASGIFGSVVGAVIVLLVYRRFFAGKRAGD